LKVFLMGRIAIEAEGAVIEEQHFPGRQGRLLFAYLVAEQGRPVPRDELANVLWGDAPPTTWDKALSVLASKLRGVLVESGVDGASALTAAFGCYRLDLPRGTWIDVHAAESAATEAEGFLQTNELDTATTAAALAESVTRSPFLPGEDGPWVEEKRRELAEVHVRALSALAEASLRAGKAAEGVRWAGLVVEAEPFRESGYRNLMEAHIAAGNRAEALRVYERCRLLLAEELGTYPSPETESIYRSLLEAPVDPGMSESPERTPPARTAPPPGRHLPRPARRRAALLGLVALVAAATVIAFLATRADEPKTASSAPAPRQVALVVPSSSPWNQDPSTGQYRDALSRAKTEDAIQTQTFAIDPFAPLPPRVRTRIGKFGLVLLAGQFVANRFVGEFARHPLTQFLVVDPDPVNGALFNAVTNNPNTRDVFFIEGPGARLAGYLSGLMAKKQSSPSQPVVISEILVNDKVSVNVDAGFEWGASDAVRGIRVLKSYAGKSVAPAVCETIADKQIRRGSRVVFADAGACSAGALDAAQNAGVWAVAGDQDPSNPPNETQVIGYTVKDFGKEVDYAISHYLDHTLPHLHHFDIGIEQDAVNFVPTTTLVPKATLTKLEQYREKNMPRWRKMAKQQ
jgi:DNA-binding SARP family transcriptional activator/basic membrane lipoprotein Med (substrate-binding protein (PBP1-ABC) superfamily)